MEQEQILKIKETIGNLEKKNSRLYFLVQDTKGNAKGSVRYIYQMARTLKENGFNPIMLTEKNDYQGVAEWLGNEYMELPHQSIENRNLEISPEDFIIVPEIYGFIMEQIKNLPCGKIVIAQAYDQIVDTIQPGQSWYQLGFNKVITTSEESKNEISSIMKNQSWDIIEPTISKSFSKATKPPKPVIAVHSRDQRDTINLIKKFYLKFPQFRWITFRDMRGLSETQFAQSLKECCAAIWIDETSGFGTFPLECMITGVPVLGLTPNVRPKWLSEENGIWVHNKNVLPDLIAEYIQNWLEDNISDELYQNMEQTNQYQDYDKFESSVITTFTRFLQTRALTFKEQIESTQTV